MIRHVGKSCWELHPERPSEMIDQHQCRRCQRLMRYTRLALAQGAPICDLNHGIVHGNAGPNGECLECQPTAALLPDPPATWLDWALVWQVLQGAKPVRKPTSSEMACIITTVARRNGWGHVLACGWLRENTQVEIPKDHGWYLLSQWAKRRGVRPVSLAEAIYHENEPDVGAGALDPYDPELEEDAA